MRVEMKKIYEAAIILLSTLGWWGFVYPELCLTEDVYEEKTEAEWVFGEIRIKSRIVEYVYQVKEKAVMEKRLENDR